MQTSDKGIAALKIEEGEVLRAYRDVVGVWTIGVGLTAASGVVKPKAGMVITAAQSTELLRAALRENYEPAVGVAMSSVNGSAVYTPKQHEFDAGVSFHFNTGAIKRASWVTKWKGRAGRQDIRRALMMWNKGGGKVLPGLTARRDREAAMLFDAQYVGMPVEVGDFRLAKIALLLSSDELKDVRSAFRKLGYDPGPDARGIYSDAVQCFQRDHSLTEDGILGRATLSTLQRRLNAVGAAALPAAATVSAPPIVATDYVDAATFDGASWIGLGLVGLWAIATAWQYRDVIAAKIARPTPRLATFLRSF